MNRLMLLCLVIPFIGVGTTTVEAALSQQEAADMARKHPCAMSLATDSRLLRLTRNEDLEDDLFSLQIRIEKSIAKETYVFKVTSRGYFVLSPEEVVHVSQTGNQYALIAVTKRRGNAYGLYGCPNAQQNFSDLIGDVRIRISTEAEAVKFALLNYSMTKDPERERIIFDFRRFRHYVEDRFFAWFSESRAERNFRRWSDQDAKRGKAATLGVEASREADEYITSLTYASGSSESIDLERVNLEVDESGVIKKLRVQTVLSVVKSFGTFRTILGNVDE